MRRIHSVGHSSRSAEALCALLHGAEIATLVDVRRVPASGRHPWFGRRTLDATLAGAGITYHWLGEGLGGLRAASGAPEDSRNAALRDASLRAYADAFSEERFLRDLSTLEGLAEAAPTAMLCAERDWRRCHRQLLADLLVVRGAEVVHLLDEQRSEPHALHEWARVEDRCVTYPGLL